MRRAVFLASVQTDLVRILSYIARMSGSGATCFALFADRAAALEAGAVLARAEPLWWSAAGALLTAPPPVEEHPQALPGTGPALS